jgi:two-component system, NarL family, sensor histidine kinase UhpB
MTFIGAETKSGTGRLGPAARRLLAAARWQQRSVRVQLLIVFVVIDMAAGLLAGAVTIYQARSSTREEVAASMALAELLVSEAVGLMQQQVPAERFLADLTSQLRHLRHVRIVTKDAGAAALASAPSTAAPQAATGNRAPAWFAALIAPQIGSRDVPVVVNGERIGAVEIVPEPHDEIAEAWSNTVALATVALAVNAGMIAVLYVLFGRVLDPLTALTRGLADLEERNYQVRLKRPAAPELAAIVDRFNALAAALEALRTENEALNRRLIAAQDDERRRTALELHDEVGPSLFGLKVNVNSIASAAATVTPNATARKLKDRARDMLAIVEHLQAINRSMLNRLRPMALGHVPLRDVLAELVQNQARQHPQIAFSFSAEKLMPSYGDSIDLTVYRCVQESLTNVVRHANAKRVDVALDQATGERPNGNSGASLQLIVRDDGCGMDASVPPGFGLRGMQERVEGLGGRYGVESAHGHGTCVRIEIPLQTG